MPEEVACEEGEGRSDGDDGTECRKGEVVVAHVPEKAHREEEGAEREPDRGEVLRVDHGDSGPHEEIDRAADREGSDPEVAGGVEV